MPLTCNVRPVLPEDVPELVEADARWNRFHDPDLDRELVPVWSLDGDSLMDFIRQYDDGQRRDTRVFAVERPVPPADAAEAEAEGEWEVVGGFGYLLEDSEYALCFVALKEGCVDEAVAAIADHFRRRLRGKRRRVRLVFRDTDRNLREMWPAWRAQGYRIRLRPDYFRGDGVGTDGWLVESPPESRAAD